MVSERLASWQRLTEEMIDDNHTMAPFLQGYIWACESRSAQQETGSRSKRPPESAEGLRVKGEGEQ